LSRVSLLLGRLRYSAKKLNLFFVAEFKQPRRLLKSRRVTVTTTATVIQDRYSHAYWSSHVESYSQITGYNQTD